MVLSSKVTRQHRRYQPSPSTSRHSKRDKVASTFLSFATCYFPASSIKAYDHEDATLVKPNVLSSLTNVYLIYCRRSQDRIQSSLSTCSYDGSDI